MERKCRVVIIVCLKDQMHNTIAFHLMKNLQLITATGLNYTVAISPVIFEERALRLTMSLHIAGNYDVVVVIGDFFSRLLAQKIYQELIPLPTVFIGVSDPVRLGLVESLERPGGNVSGLIVAPSNLYVTYAEKIALFYPHISRILIPYWPNAFSGVVGHGAIAGAQYLRSKGFIVELQETETAPGVKAIVDRHIASFDAVWLLEGCISCSIIPSIAYKCWKQSKILFCSGSRDGIEVGGAAASYGLDLTKYATEAGTMIRRYWEGRVSLGLQPVIQLTGTRTLFFNEDLLVIAGIPRALIDALRGQDDCEVLKVWVNKPKQN